MTEREVLSAQPRPEDGPPPLTRGSRVLAVVPHFRCEDWLGTCLASLTAQTRPPDAIVVIDDCSPEAPTDIVARFPTVTLLRAAENVGPYRLVQQVVEDTDYDGYLFQDADDWSAPDRLARLLHAGEVTGAALIGSDYLAVRCDTGVLEPVGFPVEVNTALAVSPTRHALQHPTSLVARELVVALGGYASGMRFSGDDEFLRRAAHVARVRNVPRVLYFRRHRAGSLTTAAETGHGSPARRAVLAEMAERARRNVEAADAGEAPNLAPLRRGLPITLEHLTGPDLSAGGAARHDAPTNRTRWTGADTRTDTRAALPPVLVVGTDRAACELVAWSLGQHPAIEPVTDPEVLLAIGRAAREAARGGGTSSLGSRGITEEHLRAAAAATADRLALGTAAAPPQEPTVAEAAELVAGPPPVGTRRWAGVVPARADLLRTAVWLYPEAQVVHVVGGGAETDAEGLRAALLAERAVGAHRTRRVDVRRLRAEPEETLAACLTAIGEPPAESCAWPVRALDPPSQAAPPDDLLALALADPGPGDPQALEVPDPPGDHPTAPRDLEPARSPQPAPAPPPLSPAVSPVAAPTVELVRSVARPGQTVAVISRGDPDLLALGEAEGWHFPRMPDGTYTGYHPQCSEDAIAHLEQLREQGADLLAVPATGMWWMEHYTAFREHLEHTYRLAAYRKDAGMVFDLRPAAAAPRAPGAVADRRTARPRRLKVQVLAWNVTHNPLGRAHLLAELLAPHHDVEIVGAAFPQFGEGVWPPHRDSPVPIRTYPGGPFPEHHRRMEEVARDLDGDVLLVSKPRWPSLGVGFLAKQARNRAIVLDIDDRELAFVGATGGIDAAGLRAHRDREALANPHGRLWTQACEGLVGEVDAITVSNDALAAVYGGTVIPHARDEALFDPVRHDRNLARKRLGFEPDDRVVLFPGTPRRHKGLVELAHALAELDDPRAKLCFIEAAEYKDLRADLAGLERWLHPVPYRPFAELPALLVAADVVCALQDPSSEVARYQMPAKITDAFAMQVPCLVRPVPPLRSHIDAGRLEVLDGPTLAARLGRLLDELDACRDRAAANRDWFLSQASYGAVGPVLADIVRDAARAPRPLGAAAGDVLALQRERYGSDRESTSAPARPPSRRTGARPRPGGELDVVLFWKQNDTGIYGRRHDMLLAQLARSRRVRRIVQFDHPIGVDALAALERGTGQTHDALVLAQTLRRLEAPPRFGKLRQHTFVHAGDDGSATWRGQAVPHREDYLDYVANTLKRHGVGRRPTVLWVYPKNFDFPAIADVTAHDLVLADVVDDHRAWATPGSARRALIARNYEEILARSDVVLTNCESMRERTALLAPHVALVPNGCDLRVRRLAGRTPSDLRALPRPIIGYAGNLSSRIDVELLDELVGRRRDWSFVFIGSTHAGKQALRLDAHPNAHFLGPRPYEEARRYVRAFDVGIIPHLDNEMTRAMNPLKAFVYVALGTPTVATRIAGLDELAPFMRVADTPEDFESAVGAALADGRRGRSHAARRALGDQSWERRMEQILTLVDSGLAAGAPEVAE